MATLSGKKIKDTYGELLHVGSGNSGISNALLPVQDGMGSNTPIWISAGTMDISGNFLVSGREVGTGYAGGQVTQAGKLAEFNTYGQLDYSAIPLPDLNRDIDKRIWGLTATTGNKQIYSSVNHTTATYIRNTGCWAYGIDLTPISVWNSQGANQRGGILISPRHVLMANHYPVAGIMRWVDLNNNVVSGGLSGDINIAGTDLRIGVLSGDITGAISFAKVFSSGFTGYFNTSGMPMLFTDQEEKALVGQTNITLGQNIDIEQSSELYRSGFYELPIGGDSGDPVCGVIGNELVVLTTFYSAMSGPNISYYYDLVNSGINALGNSNGYQLTPVAQTYFPINWNSLKNIPTGLGASITNVTNNINYTTVTGSGFFSISYQSGIVSGVDVQMFSFTSGFASPPNVTLSIQPPSTGQYLYDASPSGITTSGFYACYSSPIEQNGYLINVIAIL